MEHNVHVKCVIAVHNCVIAVYKCVIAVHNLKATSLLSLHVIFMCFFQFAKIEIIYKSYSNQLQYLFTFVDCCLNVQTVC